MAYFDTLASPSVPLTFLSKLNSILKSAAGKMSVSGQHRSTRAALSYLDARQLRDIGLTRTDVNALDTSARWAKTSPSRALTNQR